MQKPTLLYYDILNFRPQSLELLEKNFQVLRLPDPTHDTDEILARTEILTAPLGHPVDAARIARCPRLKVIASVTLHIPHINAEAARSRGIKTVWFGSDPEFVQSVTPTAELCWGLIIALTRAMPWAIRAAEKGEWGGRPWGYKSPRMLSRMSLGIVGLGRLGRMTAERALPFGMKVRYFSPNSTDPRFERSSSLLELAAASDVVSLHAKHGPSTDRMIGREFFQAMRPGSWFVNTARGELTDENALLDALESGRLAGAALDVISGEHSPGFDQILQNSRLIDYAAKNQNLIITPHYAGATLDAWTGTQTRTIQMILQALDGGAGAD